MSGLVFDTDDTRGLYETLQARGVTDFTQEPTDHFYGTDMGLRDPFGNVHPDPPAQRTGRRARRRPDRPTEGSHTMATTKTTTKRSSATKGSENVWTDEERAAMQESARERKASSRERTPEGRARRG